MAFVIHFEWQNDSEISLNAQQLTIFVTALVLILQFIAVFLSVARLLPHENLSPASTRTWVMGYCKQNIKIKLHGNGELNMYDV